MADNDQSKRPEDTDFKQQRLKAWQPILTPKWVISSFIFLGIIFIPVGVVILNASNSVVEFANRYDDKTECVLQSDGDSDSPDYGRSCFVDMSITADMEFPVYVYYQLTNFYQNHRRYVKSRSDSQLRGESDPDLSGCDPLTNNNDKKLYPCGLIAASYFSDQIYAQYLPGGDLSEAVNLTNGFNTTNDQTWKKDGISWASDRKEKFKLANYFLDEDFNDTFTREGPEQELINDYLRQNRPDEDLVQIPLPHDEDLIVWMRTAGLSTFKKLYRIIDGPISDASGTDTFTKLQAGDKLRFHVKNFFRVADFGGQKTIVISTTTWLGGKNSFLGYAYIVVGTICFILALIFFTKHTLSPRKLGDMRYFKWHAEDNSNRRRNVG